MRIGGDHAGVDAIVQQAKKDIAPAHRGDKRTAAEDAACIGIGLHGGDPAQPRDGALRYRLRDEDAGTGGATRGHQKKSRNIGKPVSTFPDHALIAALTLGSTFSANNVIERLASAGSRQSLPA